MANGEIKSSHEAELFDPSHKRSLSPTENIFLIRKRKLIEKQFKSITFGGGRQRILIPLTVGENKSDKSELKKGIIMALFKIRSHALHFDHDRRYQ